jgi:hypothetical protein
VDPRKNEVQEEEELEDLEDLDGTEDTRPPQTALPRSTSLFDSCLFPILAIDGNFRIVYANPRCQELFTGFSGLNGNQFFDVFGRSFGIEALREIRATVLEGKNGFSWKGYSMLKSRERETLRSRVFVFPADRKRP